MGRKIKAEDAVTGEPLDIDADSICLGESKIQPCPNDCSEKCGRFMMQFEMYMT